MKFINGLTEISKKEFLHYEKFKNWYKETILNKKVSWYENFKEGMETKIYLDYDFEKNEVVNSDDIKLHCKKCCNKILDFINYLSENYNINEKLFKIRIASRTGNGYYTKPNGKSGYKLSLRFFINVSINYLIMPNLLKDFELDEFFDIKPYTKNQKLNLIGCIKAPYDKRQLLPYDLENETLIYNLEKINLEEFIVGYTDDCIFHLEYEGPDVVGLRHSDNIKLKKEVKEINKNNDILFNQVEDLIINCLSDKRAEDYKTWTLILWSIIYTFKHDDEKCYYLCHLFSKKCDYKYNEIEVDNFIQKNINKEHSTPRTLLSLFYEARTDNPEEFKKIIEKHKDFTHTECADIIFNLKIEDWGHSGCAEIIFKLKKDDFIFNSNEKEIYCFNGKYWEKDDHFLRKFMINDLKNLIKEIMYSFETKSDEFKSYYKMIKDLGNEIFKKNVILSCRDFFLKKVEFDNIPHILPFENGCYNLITKQFEDHKKSNYTTQVINYEYRKPTDKEVERFEEIFYKIIPKEDTDLLNTVLQIYTTGLWGSTLERFIVQNGVGGNGKGVLNALMKSVIDIFYSDANNQILTSPIKTGGNPEISNLQKKRFIVFREPDENIPIQNKTVHELTGNSTVIKARKLYSNNDDVKIEGTFILECNEKPKFSSKITNADYRRLIDIKLPNVFTNEEKDINNKNIFYADPTIKNKENLDFIKYAFLDLLLNFNSKFENYDIFNIKLPESIKKRTDDYLVSSNIFTNWFKENHENTENEKDILKSNEIFEGFKNSDEFQNLDKQQKRNYTKKEIINILQSNRLFNKKYKVEHRFYEKNIQKKVRNCLIGWKMKNDEDFEEV